MTVLRHTACSVARVSRTGVAGGGSSLLARPSVALRRLVGCEWRGEVSAFEPPHVDAAALVHGPVLAFVLARRDLHAHRQKMDAAVRVNTVRQYAFEAGFISFYRVVESHISSEHVRPARSVRFHFPETVAQSRRDRRLYVEP